MIMFKRLSLDSRFKLGFVINASFMLLEFIVGILTGSLILVADAAHNMTDSFTLVISWLGNKVAKKPADDNHSLGHGRISVLAAFINSVILVAVAIFIFYEAYQRFLHPAKLEGGIIAVIAFVGILANSTVALLFRKDRSDLNVRAAYMNMAFDAIFSVAALLAGVLILITGRTWIDPLISIGVGIGLFYASYGILKQATHIFLEGVPSDVNLQQIREVLLNDENVEHIEDISAWAISSEEYILYCRVIPTNKQYDAVKLSSTRLRKALIKQGFAKVIIESA